MVPVAGLAYTYAYATLRNCSPDHRQFHPEYGVPAPRCHRLVGLRAQFPDKLGLYLPTIVESPWRYDVTHGVRAHRVVM